MWRTYTFTCDPDECDSLIEFTARDGYGFPMGIIVMHCPCGRMMNYLGCQNTNSPDETVTEVTYTEVVKINTNPYNL